MRQHSISYTQKLRYFSDVSFCLCLPGDAAPAEETPAEGATEEKKEEGEEKKEEEPAATPAAEGN